MRLFFSVGEPSGDLHGANLIASLRRQRPDTEFLGFGGPLMQQAGLNATADMTKLAIMWLSRALLHLPKFLALLQQADRCFQQQRPDAVILIDFPGFNWWVARRAKARGIPVFYYGPPQIWAWAGWRIGKLRRLTDHVFCKLPFEEDWLKQQGCAATYVGHPYFDELSQRVIDPAAVKRFSHDSPLLTLLPGSRRQEVVANLPVMLDTVKRMRRARCKCRFAIASFNDEQAALARDLMARDNGQLHDVEVHAGCTAELITAASCCLACSGSVSLELLYHCKPAVIVYRVSRFAYRVQDRVRTSRYITLANLLASPEIFATAKARREHDRIAPSTEPRVPFPEFLSYDNPSKAISAQLIEWLSDETATTQIRQQLAELRDRYAQPGASARAAEGILARLKALDETPAPHFRGRRSARPPSTRVGHLRR